MKINKINVKIQTNILYLNIELYQLNFPEWFLPSLNTDCSGVYYVVAKTLIDQACKITSNDSAKWIPRPVIKPVVEVVEAFLCQELGSSVVEIWIKFVND